MNFSTKRLTIRPFDKDDEKDLVEIHQDPDTVRFTLHEAWTSQNQHEEFLKRTKNTVFSEEAAVNLAVVFENKVIGDLFATYTELKGNVEIGYVFSKDYRGQAFASEAVVGLIRHIFSNYEVHRICASLDARNIPSAKLCERIGMRKEAHFIEDYWSKGEWTDTFVYGILESEIDKLPEI